MCVEFQWQLLADLRWRRAALWVWSVWSAPCTAVCTAGCCRPASSCLPWSLAGTGQHFAVPPLPEPAVYVDLVAGVSHHDSISHISHSGRAAVCVCSTATKPGVGQFAMAVPQPCSHRWWQTAAVSNCGCSCPVTAAAHAVLPVPVVVLKPLCL